MPESETTLARDIEAARKRILDLEAECQALREGRVLANDLRQAKDLLRQSYEDHRLIFASSPFGVSILAKKDPDRRLFVNQRMAEMFGYSQAEEMLSFSAADSYVNQQDIELLRQASREGTFISDLVMERYRKDGSRWWCHLFRRQAVFEGQEVVIAWHADVTETKQAEAALKASEARYASVVDSQSEFITRFRPDGTFTFVNGAYCQFIGKPEADVLSSTVFDFLAKDEVGQMQSYYASFTPENPVQETDKKLSRHDGELRDVEWRDTAYFGSRGDIIEFQAVARDVTERRQVRAALERANEQAQQANLAKSSFLATMSHEIRTPLNGVLGLAQLLGESHLDSHQRKKVDTILSSGQTLLAILNDVLDMSKIEAGGLDLEETTFSLQDLVATVATPFQSLADDKGLRLRVTSQLETDTLLNGDPVRLRQILWNLMSNAIKFTDQGSVTLTISEIHNVGDRITTEKDCALSFSVQDSGTGIASDRVDTIFESFTQEDNSITRKFGGTGLGLTIVKQLAEMMGGSISVTSEIGVGTQFNVCLPFFRASAVQAERFMAVVTPDSTVPMAPLRIIVAEDNAINAMVAREFLTNFGHQVRHAKNGLIAVEFAADDWADLILMDIHMPEMDGIEATKLIRATARGASLPIVGLTAEAFTERHTQFLEAGMNDVLTKPYTALQLANMLRSHTLGPGSGEKHPPVQKQEQDDPERVASAAPSATADAAELPEMALPIGDDEKLRQLAEQLGVGALPALLAHGRISLQAQTDALRKAVTAADADSIARTAHGIKGSCGSLFAYRISGLAAVIETNASDFALLEKLLPHFETTAEETLKWWSHP